MPRVSDQLRELRRRTGLGLVALADLAGVASADLRSWEAGTTIASGAQLDALTRAVGLRLRDLTQPADEWPLDQGLFRATGPTAPSALDPSSYRTICEFKRCVAEIDELERAIGRAAGALSTEHVAFDPLPPHGAVEMAARVRTRLHIQGSGPVRSVTRLLMEELDVRIFAVSPDELPASIHAMSTRAPRPAVLINLFASNPRVRYALAHELCHLQFDLHDRADVVSTDAGAFDDIERRADAFAANFLAPEAGVRAAVIGDPSSEKSVRDVAARFCIGRTHAINRICDTFGLHGLHDAMLHRPRLSWNPDLTEDLPLLGLRSGVLLDTTVEALRKGVIGRLRAREVLRVRPSESLPPHPDLTDEQRAPLRQAEATVQSAVAGWLERRFAKAKPADPVRVGDTWEVEVRTEGGTISLTVSRDLEVSQSSDTE